MLQVIATGREIPLCQARMIGSYIKTAVVVAAFVLAALVMTIAAPAASAADAPLGSSSDGRDTEGISERV